MIIPFGTQMTIIIHLHKLNDGRIRLMYEESIKLLKLHGVEFETGLTIQEITKIEDVYKIKFPNSLKKFLMMALPISMGFYNWRNLEQDNVMFIKKIVNRPIEDVDELAEEVYWCDDWGEEPTNEMDIALIVRERLKSAPKLIPIYGHRYIPMTQEDNPPIISIHDIDIIYYGQNLEDYFKVEFGEKEQGKIDFKNINPIPFWSDIM